MPFGGKADMARAMQNARFKPAFGSFAESQ